MDTHQVHTQCRADSLCLLQSHSVHVHPVCMLMSTISEEGGAEQGAHDRHAMLGAVPGAGV